VDSSGNAVVTGATISTNFPVTAGAIQSSLAGGYDAFVAKLNATGTAWQYVTYLGGPKDDFGYGVGVDSSGGAFVAGYTISTAFPRAGAFQPAAPNSSTVLYKSSSGGSSWHADDGGIASWPFDVVADPSSATHLIVGSQDGMYQTTDGGAHWLATATFAGQFAAGIAFSPTGSPIYAASFTSVYAGTDGGSTWNLRGTAPCAFATIAVNPSNPATLYGANGSSNLVFAPACAAKSTDGGATWTALSGLTFNFAVFGFAINPATPTTLYAATDSGLFKSTDAG
jgi:photosystem II stability/assembly factor-like uncharacterized protein